MEAEEPTAETAFRATEKELLIFSLDTGAETA
jgi:hypothetical protein